MILPILTLFFLFIGGNEGKSPACSSQRLVHYEVRMRTFWAKETFPKHFPEFRPPAQWSKLIGRAHNTQFSIFRLGEKASEGLKIFSQTSSSDLLDIEQGPGILDAFSGPPVLSGVGETETQFFADGNHSKVSLVARIVPSPDWFVGLDSVDLCMNGEWAETLSLDALLLDSGTDNGFTFTSPNWETSPQEPISLIYRIHSHPANSFYYPDKKRNKLPLANFVFIKLKEYSLSEEHEALAAFYGTGAPETSISDDLTGGEESDSGNDLAEGTSQHLNRRRKLKKSKRGRIRGSDHCLVSEWSNWSECSAKCGLGEQERKRHVKRLNKANGCSLPLKEKRVCNSAADCRQNYFSW